MKRAVFLDRDGVINRAIVRDGKPYPPRNLNELEMFPGILEDLERLHFVGFIIIVVTNQPDVARGTQNREMVENINTTIKSQLPIDEFFVCYHDDADHCQCRKPLPGMLLDAAKRFSIDLKKSFMVGDRWRDIEVGRRAGCSTVLVDNKYAEKKRSKPDVRVSSLREAVDWILNYNEEEISMNSIGDLKIKIFADGADKAGMLEMYAKPYIKGFTTNPTLMRKAGVVDYREFAKIILQAIPDRSISFEVFSDEFDEMERQALEIAGLGKNVYVKIPVTNTRGEASNNLVRRLARAGVKLNVTALMTLNQVRSIGECLASGPSSYISVFAGRIADTGRDPVPHMTTAMELLRPYSNIELVWASPRELLNIFQANVIGCHIITVTNDLLKKIDTIGKDLSEFSLDTVKMFYEDARKAGYRI